MLMTCAPKQCRQAKEGGKWMSDDEGRNTREVGSQTAFVLEPFSKRARRKDRAELWHDASGDVDPTECAERQGKIACDRPKHGTKHTDRLAAARFTLANARVSDLGRREGCRRHPIDFSKRVVQVDEAGS